MDEALQEAPEAFARGDWPVGSVIVRDGVVLSRGQNRQNTERDLTEHGIETLGGATVYSTMEPCPMCSGASSNVIRPLPSFSWADGPSYFKECLK
jgi:tRNA(adenine34) deaminase